MSKIEYPVCLLLITIDLSTMGILEPHRRPLFTVAIYALTNETPCNRAAVRQIHGNEVIFFVLSGL